MADARAKVTVPAVRARKGGDRLTMVTAYDFPSAQIASEAGIDMILVGDSVGNAVHGFEDTLRVTVDMMVLHGAAVARAKPHSLVVVDMPWLSYHVSIEEAIRRYPDSRATDFRLVRRSQEWRPLPDETSSLKERENVIQFWRVASMLSPRRHPASARQSR